VPAGHGEAACLLFAARFFPDADIEKAVAALGIFRNVGGETRE